MHAPKQAASGEDAVSFRSGRAKWPVEGSHRWMTTRERSQNGGG